MNNWMELEKGLILWIIKYEILFERNYLIDKYRREIYNKNFDNNMQHFLFNIFVLIDFNIIFLFYTFNQ